MIHQHCPEDSCEFCVLNISVMLPEHQWMRIAFILKAAAGDLSPDDPEKAKIWGAIHTIGVTNMKELDAHAKMRNRYK